MADIHGMTAARVARTVTVTAALLTAMLLAGCGEPNAQQGPKEMPPPAVSVAEAPQREVVQWDEFTGRVEAVESVQVRARVAGYLQNIHFHEGAEVKKGDPLFQIDPRPFQAEHERAAAELERARIRADQAKVDLGRAEKLLAIKAISQEEFETRTWAVKDTQSAVGSAQAVLATARLNLQYSRITAPVSGRVSRANVTEGNLIDSGAVVLTTIVSVDPVYVYFDADERTLLRYIRLSLNGERPSSREVRNPVEVGLADEDGFPHKGHIDFVDNRVDPATGTMRARARLNNPQRILTPGMFARVRIPGSGKFQALLVTDRAVMTDQNNKFLFVVNAEGKAEYRRVVLGPVIDGMRVIKDGLRPGERVVVNGMQRVRPGIPVQAQLVPMPEGKTGNGAAKPGTTPAAADKPAASASAK